VAREFKAAIAAVEAVLFLTPEYNRSIPGALCRGVRDGNSLVRIKSP
jgi:hypothetical protein